MLYALISIIILVLVALYFGVGVAARSLADRRARSLLGNGRLAITFDDGPSPGLTNQILDLLLEFEARATFFLIGETAEANPSVVQRIAAEGHTVGWHSKTHLNQWKVNPVRAWRDSIRLPEILKAGPTSAAVYRPPYGKMNLLTVLAVRLLKLPISAWTRPSGDTYTPLPSTASVVTAIDEAGGGVVLMHDMTRSGPGGEERDRFVLDLTRALLELSRDRGWKLVSAIDV
jgi:peptidoglycan/xylan/chitin deacetylase (PgdA/CDA1 family)